MKKLRFILEIDDSEVVRDYQEIAKELILEDLKEGDLLDFCSIINVAVMEE